MKTKNLIFLGFLCLLTCNFAFGQWANNGATSLYTFDKVGIGTNTPKESLQLGDRWAFHSGGHKVISYNSHYVAGAGFKRYVAGRSSSIRFTNTGQLRFEYAASGAANSTVGWATSMFIQNNGKIGINTTTPDFHLDVKGTIRANEVRVESGWSDHVFLPEYKLPTLQEEESHIQENGHLIGFESEEAMNGQIKVADVTNRQQVKIEELMLHLIDLSKQVDQLSIDNQQLKADNSILKEDLQKMKAPQNK